jgi:hypothetical protein
MNNRKNAQMQLESIKEPQKVKILILSEHKTTIKDLYFVRNFVNLIKIDLSHNKLSTFPNGFTFRSFQNLRSLFLHYNKFQVLKNLIVVT